MCAVLFGCVADAYAQEVAFKPAFPQLWFDRPLWLGAPPDDTDRVFVVEQAGRIGWFRNSPDAGIADVHVALDIRDRVRNRHNEEGLLGMAFHPDFKDNGHVYLHYSANRPTRNVLSRWTMNGQRRVIDPDSEHVLMQVRQPWGNHNGGDIHFGPDGYLYITLGDGGAAGDPRDSAQNLTSLLGKILRIDVDRTQGDQPYAVPPDNPFVNDRLARGEIFAYGLRNVWRFSIDAETGHIWAADVGQESWEEIDLIVPGGNYGWRRREGMHPYQDGQKTADMIDPVVEHNRHEAQSITGGFVYRGSDVPALVGAYIYGDYVTGKIWALRYDGEKVTEHREIGFLHGIASFGIDAHNELHVICLGGDIYKMVPK